VGDRREDNACFTVRDKSNMYFQDEPGRRTAANLLTPDEAGRIAAGATAACRPGSCSK